MFCRPKRLGLLSLVVSLIFQCVVFAQNDVQYKWKPINTGLEGGTVRALAISVDGSAIYAGTLGAGIFKSPTEEADWTPINTGLANSHVQALACSPHDVLTLYAGTRDGIFRSRDGGARWEPINDGLLDAPGYRNVKCLAVDPTSQQVVYAGTQTSGLFRSDDGGDRWSAINTGISIEDRPTLGVLSVAVSPHNANLLYAGTTLGGVFRSKNGGKTWEAINNGIQVWELAYPQAPWIRHVAEELALSPVGFGGPHALGVFAIHLHPTDPLSIYVGTGTGGVFYSGNGGESWSVPNVDLRVEAYSVQPTGPVIRREHLRRATRDGQIISDAAMTTVLDIATSPHAPGNTYVTTTRGEVFQSVDDGRHWKRRTNGLEAGSAAYPDAISAIVVHPKDPKRLYVGTRLEGVMRSTNSGRSWEPFQQNLHAVTVKALAVDPDTPERVYAGTFGKGLYRSEDRGARWHAIDRGRVPSPIASITVDPHQPRRIYVGTHHGMFVSQNRGGTWRGISRGLSKPLAGKIYVHPRGPSTLYAATATGLYRSNDYGKQWKELREGLPKAFVVASFLLHPEQSGRLYAGGAEARSLGYIGRLFVSDNNGNNWRNISDTLALPRELYENRPDLARLPWSLSLALDPYDSNLLYNATTHGLYVSNDGGQNWELLSAEVTLSDTTENPHGGWHGLVVTPSKTGIAPVLYFITNGSGIYQSHNRGASWQRLNDGLNNLIIAAFEATPDGQTLYVATRGGGVFRMDLE